MNQTAPKTDPPATSQPTLQPTPGDSTTTLTKVLLAALAALTLVLGFTFVQYRKADRAHQETLKSKHDAEAQAQESSAARDEALTARAKAEERYEKTIWLTDLGEVRALIARDQGQKALHPREVPELDAWIERAKELRERLELHRKTLATLEKLETREAAAETERQWLLQVHRDLIAGLEGLTKEGGALSVMEARRNTIREREKVSLKDHESQWAAALSEIVDREKNPHYDGLAIPPQFGLVPVGTDPKSGFWEFAHVGSGRIPKRGADGILERDSETALVFVLIPPGQLLKSTFPQGLWGIQAGRVTQRGVMVDGVTYASTAQRLGVRVGDELIEYEEKAGWENATDGEIRVTVYRDGKTHTLQQANRVNPKDLLKGKPAEPFDSEAFFLSKYELTRAQWGRLSKKTSGGPAAEHEGKKALFPQVGVSGIDFTAVLEPETLTLPTVDEWDFAASGGVLTRYWTGDDEASLSGAENLPVATKPGPPTAANLEVLVSGGLRPNPYGLYDILGNVSEWCRWSSDVRGASPTETTLRGGNWMTPLMWGSYPRGGASPAAGVRVARVVEK